MLCNDDIASLEIYPGIGICRVGNAPDAYFFAPEVPGEVPQPPGGFKDAKGRVKREACRFRVYARDAEGKLLGELTHGEGVSIEWRVELANLKAGWYQFNDAMDLPDGMAIISEKRNKKVLSSARLQLDIVPGTRSISGPNQQGRAYQFESGKFYAKRVYLGELRTDDEGRLIVLAGRGDSAPQVAGTKATTFANNDGWHDDVADGPVRATIRLPGREPLEATPAYVVSTPPNFAPGLVGPVTMDDVLRDLYTRLGWIEPVTEPSFTRDIWPIFAQLASNQWVNEGVAMLVGHNSPADPYAPAVIERLSSKADEQRSYRQAWLALFRNPESDEVREAALPPFYSDAFGDFDDVPQEFLSITPSMYRNLEAWAKGDFVADWKGVPEVPSFESLENDLEAQCEALNRAPMHQCLGGAFHPGIEITWIFRQAIMWSAPYRLNLRKEGKTARQNYGRVLTPEVCLSKRGPLSKTGAGAITRWMGVPWQTDEASCASGYNPSYYVSLPSFWAARVPNQVLSTKSYDRLIKDSLPVGQRLKHFDYRQDWYRDIQGGGYTDRINNMVAEWWEIGIVERHEGPNDAKTASLPEEMWVETGVNKNLTGGADPIYDLVVEVEDLEFEMRPKLSAAPPEASQARRRRHGRGDV